MKLTLFFFLYSFLSLNAMGYVIYGEDNRQDIVDVTDQLFLELSRSTAVMVNQKRLMDKGDNQILFSSETMRDQGMCNNEPFVDQPTLGQCSGFLVGPDILVTAGHCVRKNVDCEQFQWAFDFEITDSSDTVASLDKSNLYKCKKILEQVLDNSNDYAVIQLEREVTDRRPLEFRKEGKIALSSDLVIIGHPVGLPKKVASGAKVLNNSSKHFFTSNLDSYGGNSGSPVFDSSTGTIEGILVRGEQDFVYNTTYNCYESNKCSDNGCRASGSAEEVTRITSVSYLYQEE